MSIMTNNGNFDPAILNELNDMQQQLYPSLELLKKSGRELAEKERIYKEALSEEALRLKDGGMAVTMIDKIIYGRREVSSKRFERDVAEVMYKAAQERINLLKLKTKIIEAQVEREWNG